MTRNIDLIRTGIISSLITIICIVCFCLPIKVGIPDYGHSLGGSTVLGALCFSFFHANIFHLIVNLWALWRFRPHLHTCIIALASSVLTGLIPWIGITGEPTYGLSAFLFAAYAHAYSYYNNNIRRLVLIQLLVAFIPHINWKAHLCAFLMSYLYWRIYHGIKHK